MMKRSPKRRYKRQQMKPGFNTLRPPTTPTSRLTETDEDKRGRSPAQLGPVCESQRPVPATGSEGRKKITTMAL
ncbi:hypothetical protein PBY51_017109 [Eleginops maclovinus]|uniref:Uncharacterized protein n=1 Tax=Eleginops maclovinus TaxID=56733 RepID=A0AAN7XGG2_ELEMC|nr:hypothetical protein PBY51_017109 [Eleginops maclovinus]